MQRMRADREKSESILTMRLGTSKEIQVVRRSVLRKEQSAMRFGKCKGITSFVFCSMLDNGTLHLLVNAGKA